MADPIDYAALAREHGGTDATTPAPVDYAALAQQVRDAATTPASAAEAAAPSGGLGGFLREATQGINPIHINAAIQQAFWHPIDTAKAWNTASEQLRLDGQAAFKRGDYLTGSRKMLDWLASPLLLPMRVDQAADLMQQGQTARGLGATTDVGLTMATPQILGKITAALPTTAADAAAQAERAGEQRVVQAITPTAGPQKIRLGTQAADVAGDVARRTTARTIGGLTDEVGEHLAQANQALDDAYAGIPATQPIPTQSVIQRLQQAVDRLSVQGTGGAAVVPQTIADRVASLRQAIDEVKGLGPSATADQMRRLRIHWDNGAQAVFTPIVADNFQAARQAGQGWADARTALNDVIVDRHPEIGPLNADVHLWSTVNDVLQATAEVERVRSTSGRGLLARAVGAATGSAAGGPGGAAVGTVLGPMLEGVITKATPAMRLALGRSLTQFADALRAGQPGVIRRAIGQVSGVLPAAQQAAFTAQAIRLVQDLAPAAQQGPPAPGTIARLQP